MFWAVTIAQKDTKKRRKKPIQDQSLFCKNYLLSFAGSRDHKQSSSTLPVLSLLSTSFNYAILHYVEAVLGVATGKPSSKSMPQYGAVVAAGPQVPGASRKLFSTSTLRAA